MRKEEIIFMSSVLLMAFVAGIVIGVTSTLMYMGINSNLETVTTPTNCFPVK